MVHSLRNLNPLTADKRVYAEVSVHRGLIADERIQTFRVSPIGAADEMAYRNLEGAIRWSDDSKTATVATPDFTLVIQLPPPNRLAE